MTKKTILGSYMIFLLLTSFNDIYSYTVPTIEGVTKTMSLFQGKKILITILPAIQNTANDSLLSIIDSLGSSNAATLTIIGVPSFEDGYNAGNKAELLNWYRDKLDSSIVITDGLYTHKASGNQHALFAWLTDKSGNGHFSNDVAGIGQKYMINENGHLYAVLGPEAKYSGSAMQKVLGQ